MKPWPDDPKPVDFGDIIGPAIEADATPRTLGHDGSTPETDATPWDFAGVVAEVRNALVPARYALDSVAVSVADAAVLRRVEQVRRAIARVLGMATAIDDQLAARRHERLVEFAQREIALRQPPRCTCTVDMMRADRRDGRRVLCPFCCEPARGEVAAGTNVAGWVETLLDTIAWQTERAIRADAEWRERFACGPQEAIERHLQSCGSSGRMQDERDAIRAEMNHATTTLWNALGQPPGEVSIQRLVDLAADRLVDLAVIGVAVASEAGALDVEVNARTYADALALILAEYRRIRQERDNLAGTVELCCPPVEGGDLRDRVRAAGEAQRRLEHERLTVEAGRRRPTVVCEGEGEP